MSEAERPDEQRRRDAETPPLSNIDHVTNVCNHFAVGVPDEETPGTEFVEAPSQR